MDEGTLHMARAIVNMSIHEEEAFNAESTTPGTAKTNKTAVGKIKMHDKLQAFRYNTNLTCKSTSMRSRIFTGGKTAASAFGGGFSTVFWGKGSLEKYVLC